MMKPALKKQVKPEHYLEELMRLKEEFRRKALSFDESLLLLHYTIIFFSKILQLKFFSKEGDKNKEQSECLVHLKKNQPMGHI